MGVRAEVPVHPTDVKAQVVELGLEFGDVVADVLRVLQAEHPVAKLVGGLAQGAQGGFVDHAVGDDAALLLEGAQGGGQDGVEEFLFLGPLLVIGGREVGAVIGEHAEPGECAAHLGDPGALIAHGEQHILLAHAGGVVLGVLFIRHGSLRPTFRTVAGGPGFPAL